ncbi:unnamed protein product, partial [marine sediment metagenome]
REALFFIMTKGLVGYIGVLWIAKNIMPMSICMLLADGVIVIGAFWVGTVLVDVSISLIDAILHMVGSVIHKKEKVKE